MVFALNEPRKEKLDMYYVGPYEITSIDYAKNNVVIQRDNKIKTVHIDKIKKGINSKNHSRRDKRRENRREKRKRNPGRDNLRKNRREKRKGNPGRDN
jgi:hypothetical protein